MLPGVDELTRMLRIPSLTIISCPEGLVNGEQDHYGLSRRLVRQLDCSKDVILDKVRICPK